ncbi:hypothetical protein C2E23DRAFT_888881 [Lenzites betulinus]|nr:hypothetical protein C2E23DRAFT_888881 [Lenzites betulinus]
MIGTHRNTPAQRAWLIDEVVRNILVHVPSVGSSRTLASCARVSRALSEPALDMLWSRMVDLSPLCQLLPEDSRPNGNTTHGMSPSHIEDTHWSCFGRYARRVRKLHYHCREGPSERLTQRTFAALVRRAARAGTPLLPRLEELSWLQSSQDITPYLHFFSPSLRRVTVYVLVGAPRARADPDLLERGDVGLLSHLDAQSPDVEELSLEGIELPASLEPLLAFKRLRSLRLGTVAASVSEIVSYCAAMPTLSTLSVDLTNSRASASGLTHGRSSGTVHSESDLALHTLQELRVIGAPSTIAALLHAVHPDSPLQRVALSISIPASDPDSDSGPRCAELLATRFARTLRSVRVQYARQASRATAFAHYARPLLPLRGLRECRIAVAGDAPVELRDEDVRAMAEAWPALAALGVTVRASPAAGGMGTGPGMGGAGRPSVFSLAEFARHCPDLVSLRLPVHQAVPLHDEARLGGLRDEGSAGGVHGLREVWLDGAWFAQEDSERVRRFFARTFPRADLRPMVNAGVLCERNLPSVCATA